MRDMKTRILSLLVALLVAIPAFAQDSFVVGLSGSDLDLASATPQHALGIPYWGKEGVFIYGEATEAISAGNWVFLDELNRLTLGDTAESGTEQVRVCVSAANLTTTNKYGWVWCGAGTFEAIVVNGVAADSALTTTATAGQAGTGGDAITGCINIDAGVTNTRVTVRCATLALTNAP